VQQIDFDATEVVPGTRDRRCVVRGLGDCERFRRVIECSGGIATNARDDSLRVGSARDADQVIARDRRGTRLDRELRRFIETQLVRQIDRTLRECARIGLREGA
jgi:hypothetical protein